MRIINICLLSSILLVTGCDKDPLTKAFDRLETSIVILGAKTAILQVDSIVLLERSRCLAQPICYKGE